MAQTRKQRVLQEVKRKRQQRTVISLAIVAVLISIIGVGVWALSRNSGNYNNFPFGCLSQEYTSLHVHPWLRIYINTGASGANNTVQVSIPAAVGILNPGYTSTQSGAQAVSSGTCYEPMHTHDSSGIIHLESRSTSDTYTLGNFFDVWKVTCQYQSFDCVNVGGVNRPIVFNSTDVFGFSSGGGHTLSLIVDGQTRQDAGGLVMNQLDYCPGTGSTTPTTDPNNPCYTTANSGPSPSSYSTGHTIIIEYS